MNSITFTFTRKSFKNRANQDYDKNENIKNYIYIVCRETRTHGLNLNSYALYPNG